MHFSPEIESRLADKNVIVFDGVCVLCNGWIKFVLRFDHNKDFQFIIAQSELGETIYSALGLKSDDYETFIVVTDNKISTKLDGVFALFHKLGWPWRILSFGRILPQPLKNVCYSLVAKNRYAIFGKRDVCILPTPEIKARFLD